MNMLRDALTGGVSIPTDRKLIRISGEQTVWFLQQTITCDVAEIPPGTWRTGCFLNPKGKIQAAFRVAVDEGEAWLDAEPGAGETLASWFNRYKFRTKVEITLDESDRWINTADASSLGHREFSGGDFGEINGSLRWTVSSAPTAVEAPLELWEILRIRAGRPAFGIDYTTDHLPQEAGLASDINVEKGCFVGGEVMSRLHFLGAVNRTVRTLMLDRPVATPADILDGDRKVGTLTSCTSDEDGSYGIGMIALTVEPGTQLRVDGAEAVAGPLPAGTKKEATPVRRGSKK